MKYNCTHVMVFQHMLQKPRIYSINMHGVVEGQYGVDMKTFKQFFK